MSEEYEIPLREVAVPDRERRGLLRQHYRRTSVLRLVWDESAQCAVERDMPLPEPECGFCREAWGQYGCSATRAVLSLAAMEREARETARTIHELREALTPRFGVHHLRNAGNRTVELRMAVDQYTLEYGGMGLIDCTLRQMRDEWAQWFRAVGDRARIASDHFAALSMDRERYTWLTQTFDPTTSAIKRPYAPWDDPDWVRATQSVRAEGRVNVP